MGNPKHQLSSFVYFFFILRNSQIIFSHKPHLKLPVTVMKETERHTEALSAWQTMGRSVSTGTPTSFWQTRRILSPCTQTLRDWKKITTAGIHLFLFLLFYWALMANIIQTMGVLHLQLRTVVLCLCNEALCFRLSVMLSCKLLELLTFGAKVHLDPVMWSKVKG